MKQNNIHKLNGLENQSSASVDKHIKYILLSHPSHLSCQYDIMLYMEFVFCLCARHFSWYLVKIV